jgi:hypothetical protein
MLGHVWQHCSIDLGNNWDNKKVIQIKYMAALDY